MKSSVLSAVAVVFGRGKGGGGGGVTWYLDIILGHPFQWVELANSKGKSETVLKIPF